MVEEQVQPVAERPQDARYGVSMGGTSARLFADVDLAETPRLSSGFEEFDRVLGGGIVPGTMVLLGGEPGIGKSTLLLQVAARVARAIGPVLYASGEESEHQVKARGERLGVGDSPLYLLAETCLERILDEVNRLSPAPRWPERWWFRHRRCHVTSDLWSVMDLSRLLARASGKNQFNSRPLAVRAVSTVRGAGLVGSPVRRNVGPPVVF